MKKLPAIAAGAIAISLALAGCAPGGSAPTGKSTGAVVTDPAKMGKVTITVLDSFTDSNSPIGKWMGDIESGFMKKYPNITVARKSENANDINSTLRLRLADQATPDVVPANQGWSGVGDLSSSGLLLNLDPYAQAYGWDKQLPKTIAQQSMASTDGKNIGQGSLYGMPINQGSFITVFYNRAGLDKLGLKVPTSLSGFEKSLSAAKAGGIIPMQLGSQDASATPTLLALQDAYGDVGKILDFVYATKTVKLSDTGMTEAANTYQKWEKSGYFPTGFAGVSSGDASQKFVDGSGLFYFYYSGFLPFADQAQADRFGTFLLPKADGSPLTATGSSTQNFSVAANSHAPDASALFLDYVASKEAGNIAIKQGIAPVLGEWKANTTSSLLNDGINELNKINSNNGYVPYFDWSTPTMLDTLNQQVALLLDNQTDGAGLVKAAQANYDTFRAQKKG